MSLQIPSYSDEANILAEVKLMSGKRIERCRRRERITQEAFARTVGIGVRWLREIESGNPKSRIDDHLRCAHGLGISTGHILIPLLFLEHRMRFPCQLLHDDLSGLEARCIQFIAQYNLNRLTRQLSPSSGEDVEMPD